MAITAISRDWGANPSIVRIVSSDTLAAVTTAGYILAQADNIAALNAGPFAWVESDTVLIRTSDGWGFFNISSDFESLEPFFSPTELDLPSAQIIVGNASGIGQARAMTGVIAITNTGVTSIVDGSIVNADINAAAAIDFSKLAALPSAQILVGSAGNVATAVAVSGDISIDNAGLTAIAAGVIVNADINAAAAIDFSKLAALTSGNILVGSAGNVATSVAMSGDVTISNAGVTTISAGAIDLAMLSAGITPSHVVKFAGQPTTVGGAAAEAFTVNGVAATDLAFVQVVNDGTANVTVLQAVCTLNTLTVTFSADPGNDCVFNYQILRAAV